MYIVFILDRSYLRLNELEFTHLPWDVRVYKLKMKRIFFLNYIFFFLDSNSRDCKSIHRNVLCHVHSWRF